jgi:hypothetical protein
MTANYIALYNKFPQYSDETSKSKNVSREEKISNTISGEIYYTTGWTKPELLCAFYSLPWPRRIDFLYVLLMMNL